MLHHATHSRTSKRPHIEKQRYENSSVNKIADGLHPKQKSSMRYLNPLAAANHSTLNFGAAAEQEIDIVTGMEDFGDD